MTGSAVLAPLQLSAFALSPHSCDDLDKKNPLRNNYKICPIAQPNYTFLRLRDHLLASDVLDPVDLHCASDAPLNSRVTDLGTGNFHRNRLGVYVHWTLPQTYRTGTAAAGDDTADDIKNQNDRKTAQGFPARSTTGTTSVANPDFRPVPNRWLVTRRLNKAKMDPKTIPATFPTFQSWVVESDRLWNINDRDMDQDVDLEVDRTPFVSPQDLNPKGGRIIEGQAEIFIGRKTDFESWSSTEADSAPNVDLNILTSSNPMFPDFVMQNMNVFSIVDDFSYKDPKTQAKAYLNHAWADYHVIGWHSNSKDDPFFSYVDPGNPTVKPPKHSDRLQDCHMQLKDPGSKIATDWLTQNTSCRILCHASMYDVEYNFDQEPITVLGRVAGQQILDKQPIAVGSTPMDALLAYCQAHLATDKQAGIDSGVMHDLEVDLLRLQTLLREHEDDDVDGIQAAQDENLEQAFSKIDGGTKYHFNQQNDISAQPKGTATRVPLFQTIAALQDLNDNQAVLDNVNREIAGKRWQLFAEFWNYVSGFIQEGFLPNYTSDVSKLFDRLDSLQNSDKTKGRLAYLTDRINNSLSALKDLAKGTDDRFFQAKDPTLLLANINRGWDADFIDILNVRLSGQTLKPTSDPTQPPGWQNGSESYIAMVRRLVSKLPTELQLGSTGLLAEFFELRSANDKSSKPRTAPEVIPWFHNEDVRTVISNKVPVTTTETRGRDQWQGTQPWRPLYIEWEALYYHIPFEKYSFKEYNRFSSWGTTVVRYGIDEDLTSPPGKFQDVSRVSGRNYLLPQAASTLALQVTEVLKNTNPDDLVNVYKLPQTDQATLADKIAQLQIVTAPMTGLTSHLQTKREGMHVKPLVRMPNKKPIVIQAAADGIKAVTDGANKSRGPSQAKLDPTRLIQMMDVETTLTPYGNSIALEKDATKPPLKPVTHGQLMFTQMNIVDKFGQAIAVIDPRPPRRGQDHPTIYPCISDTYHPSAVGDANPSLPASKANVVHAQPTNSACPFISLGPSINQPARLNASFVLKDDKNQWRRITEWENPIWGWVVINYADKGLQIFLADGTFYREVRLGGRAGVSASFKWLPFDPPPPPTPPPKPDPKNVKGNPATSKPDPNAAKKDAKAATSQTPDPNIPQLDHLIAKLIEPDQVYLKAFFHMITQSLDDKQTHAPATYATFSSAIIGKPLALTNAGWSLELAHEPNRNWSTNNPNEPLRHLLQPGTNAQYPIDDPRGYTFRVKLGDAERSFDGLVGYFPSADASSIADPSASDLQLDKLYTYFMSEPQKADPRINLGPSVYPKFTPFYPAPGSAQDALPNLNAQLQVFGLLLDPFNPVHAYSAILPNKSLKLPSWAVEQALARITAFFSIGPLISPVDVSPLYNASRALSYDNVARPFIVAPPDVEPIVSIPLAPPVASSTGGAVYRYLQPYWMPAQPGGGKTITAGDTSTANTRYNPYGIDPDAASGLQASQLRLPDGPYTALEGFAQVTKQTV